jgi:signal transduction histidine kinase
MRGRPWSWITGRPRLADGLVVTFVLVFGLLVVAGNYRFASLAGWGSLFVVVNAAALWWRRRHPRAVLLFIVGVEIIKWVFVQSNDPSGLALVFAVFAVSVYDHSGFRLWVAAGAIATTLAGVTLLVLSLFPASRELIPAGAVSLVAWVVGDYMRSRRRFFIDIVAQHQKDRERAAEEERLRIARELHDVVAHNVSVIAIQAGAARVSGSSSKEALESIEQGARDTLSELNKLLGVLRKSSGVPELAPQPTLDGVDALLKPARDAGLEATLKVTGEKQPLPAGIELSAYRIVQEAITNVLKHAGASRVEVLIDYEPEGIVLTISDNGNGPGDASSAGHGLIGMRERVALFGGKMGTGTSPLGGFTVHARLPVKS